MQDSVWDFRLSSQVVSNEIILNDYNYRTASADMLANAEAKVKAPTHLEDLASKHLGKDVRKAVGKLMGESALKPYSEYANEAGSLLNKGKPAKNKSTHEKKGGVYKPGIFSSTKVGDHFLKDSHNTLYNNLIRTGVTYDYFNEKSMHIRKTLEYVDSYKNSLKDMYDNISKDKIVYDYCYTTSEGMYCSFIMSGYYQKQGYRELPLSEAEKQKHLSKMNSGWFNLTNYIDVKAFKIMDSAATVAKKEFNDDWKKYEDVLASYRITDFRAQDKQRYDSLISSIKKHSEDYFTYITWLLGCDAKKSTHAPEIKKYNDIEFWLIECDTNGSNNHIGYLRDFIQIIDYTCLGNIQLPYQYGIWDTLLRDETTLYYHLIKGQPDSFWDLLLKIRLDFSQENEQYVDTTTALNKLQDKHSRKLDERYFVEKGQAMLDFYKLLVVRVSAGISQMEAGEQLINKELFTNHLIESAMVIAGSVSSVFTINVPASDAKRLIQYFTASATVFVIEQDKNPDTTNYLSIESASSDSSGDTTDLQIKIFSMGLDIKSVYDSFAEVITESSLGSLAQFKTSLSNAISNGKYDGLLQFNRVLSSEMIPAPTTNGLKVVFKEEGGAALLNGLSLACQYFTHQDNLQKIATFGLGQTKRDELLREIANSCALLTANFIIVLDSIIASMGKALPYVLGTVTQTARSLKTLVGNLMKATKSVAFMANIVVGAISIADGLSTIQKGIKKISNGSDVGWAYAIGGSLQILSGVMAIIQGIGLLIFAGPVGVVLFLISLVAGIIASAILWIWEDESESWNAMQLWLNRCLLGMWGSQEKGVPYPPTFTGIAYASNDYFIARKGLVANIETNKEYYLIESLPFYTSGEYKGTITNGSLTRKEQEARWNMNALYIVMKFPGYDNDNSEFEGTVRIIHCETQELIAKLSVAKGDKYPKISVIESSSRFMLRDQNYLLPLDDDQRFGEYNVGVTESYDFDKDQNTGEKTGTFLVKYKVGEYYEDHRNNDSKRHKVYYQLHYYSSGKQNAGKNKSLPLLLSYQY